MASLEQINYQPQRAEISDGSLQWAPLKRKPIKNLPQIVWEDNSTWAEANLWALDQAQGRKIRTDQLPSNIPWWLRQFRPAVPPWRDQQYQFLHGIWW